MTSAFFQFFFPAGSGFGRSAALSFAAAIGLAAAVAGFYLVKSALGINLFPGHSPLLHAALYPLVRG